MSIAIKFTKMHGLGNDFVFINAKEAQLLSKKQLQRLVDRHTSIGCDQIIIYQALSSSCYQMQIYNPDGSSATMCGNAMRCLGLLALESGQERIDVIVAGRSVEVTSFSEQKIVVNMGSASFEEKWMPPITKIADVLIDWQIALKDVMCVDVGNPHLIIFHSNLSNDAKSAIGRALERHDAFPGGVNVNFASIDGNIINLQVFERGAGFTLACGSGACATFAAAVKLNFIVTDVIIRFQTGDLKMSYVNDDIIMSGGAHKVATGTYYG